MRPSRWLIAACLFAVYVIWGTTYFAIKVGIQGAPPFFLIGTRFLVAGLLLLAWQLLRGRPMPTARQWRGAALMGLLLLVIGNGGVAVAEHWVTSGATVALISVMPLATALWSGAFGEWPKRLEWAAIALGGVGAAVMLLGRDLQANCGNAGDSVRHDDLVAGNRFVAPHRHTAWPHRIRRGDARRGGHRAPGQCGPW